MGGIVPNGIIAVAFSIGEAGDHGWCDASMRRLTVIPLAAATFFVVSGGPYGLEELLAQAGYRDALLVLAATPLIWSGPTALMVAELSSALPQDGGYYRWVECALGPVSGFQETWLSLAASFVRMAILPTLCLISRRRLLAAPASVLLRRA